MVLHRVLEQGAWAAPTLDAELARSALSPRDAALATEIVYGTLRVLPALDEVLDGFLDAPERLDTFVRATLRAGTYQIRHLSRVPAFAVVNESVRLVRQRRGSKLCGLTNAVLRKVAEGSPNPEPAEHLVLPRWLREALREALGDERAERFTAARTLPAPLGLRARQDRDALFQSLRRSVPDGASVRRGTLSDAALLLRGAGDPRRLPGYRTGAFVVQEQGAQFIAQLVGVEPGESVVDACAGRGGKTISLLEKLGEEGRITAIDLHESKLDRLRTELGRLGMGQANVDTRTIDLSVGLGGLPECAFDRVLVDAPCSGVGTIHRRPELLLRLRPDDLSRLGSVQRAILSQCARLVTPGGMLFYAVCSPMPEEGAHVVADFTQSQPGFEAYPLAGADPDGMRRVGPWDDDADAYQVFRWRKNVDHARDA